MISLLSAPFIATIKLISRPGMYLLVAPFLLLSLNGCQKKEDDKVITIERFGDSSERHDYRSYEKHKAACNRIVINAFEGDSNSKYAPFSVKTVSELSEIEQFENLLADGEKTGYCCCPKKAFTISFYENTEEFDHYLVDTTAFKDKVRIFQSSFQFSYLIKKSKWDNFLNSSKSLSHYEYASADLTKARAVYTYCLQNNLVTITSNQVSKYWMYYDGNFILTVKAKGEKLNAQEVLAKIRRMFPHHSFKSEIISEMEQHSPKKEKYFNSELTVKIYCDMDLYRKFGVKTIKSPYSKTKAEFIILGKKEDLEKIKNL